MLTVTVTAGYDTKYRSGTRKYYVVRAIDSRDGASLIDRVTSRVKAGQSAARMIARDWQR